MEKELNEMYKEISKVIKDEEKEVMEELDNSHNNICDKLDVLKEKMIEKNKIKKIKE